MSIYGENPALDCWLCALLDVEVEARRKRKRVNVWVKEQVWRVSQSPHYAMKCTPVLWGINCILLL